MKLIVRSIIAIIVLLAAVASVSSLTLAQQEKPIVLAPLAETGDAALDGPYVELVQPAGDVVEAGEAAGPLAVEAAAKVYLPVITRPALTVVANGNFESGNTGWTVSSTFNRTVIRTSFAPNTATPHAGAWGAWLGGLNSESTSLQQQIAIRPGTSYLAYWHWIGSADVCGYDYAYVKVNGVTAHAYTLCSSTATGGWVKKVVNLSAYAGQTVTVRIQVSNDSSLNSNLFLDDVTFQATP